MSRLIDISDFLLGELSPEELLEAERLLREDPGFRSEVERLRPVVTRLRELPPQAWEETELPPLMVPTGTAPEASPSGSHGPAPSRGPRRRLSLRPAIAAACAVALLAAGVGAGLAIDGGGSGDGSATVAGRSVALEPIGLADEGATGTAVLAADGSGRSPESGAQARIELAGMRPSPPGTHYELWLLNTPTDLVSLGSFRVPESGSATVTVPLPEDPDRLNYIDISVERDDGDPAHSGASVMRAST